MEGAVQAAVLVPVYRGQDGKIHLVLIRRHESGVHGGQLAFPGGRHSPEDGTLLATALRETEEEIGLAPSHVQVLQELPSVDTVTTGFLITPFLGRITRPHAWTLSEQEVAEVLEVAVCDLASPGARGERVRRFDDLPEPRAFPFFRIGDYELWGATYRIVEPLVAQLLSGAWSI